MRSFAPMVDQEKGGADFSKVRVVEMWDRAYPECVDHGAMNKVGPALWRCISTAGPKINGCRAGCEEVPESLRPQEAVGE